MNNDQRRSNPNQSRSWNRCGTVATIGLCLFLFWPVISGNSEFGFRDAASLYQPLFEWTQQQWASGQVPLWCPLDNWGAPVVADATSSVFYPGKLIFFFSFIPYSILFGIYLASHIAWAVFGARWCAWKMGLSPPAQWLSAIAFGFGGSVLFQTCNVVFLIGASWLPWALGCIGCIWVLQERDQSCLTLRRAAIGLMISMAMMVLGGDPQMAFHTALVAAIWSLASCLLKSRTDSAGKTIFRSVIVLSVVIVGAVALSAIQIFPSFEWASRSERIAQNDSIDLAALVNRPFPGTQRDAIYQFSLPPWTVAELVWPNVLGKLDFATNRRWSDSIAGADRVWTGSLYVGSMLVLLGVCVMITGNKQSIDYMLGGILALFLLASFGWYGLGWLIGELQLMRGGTFPVPLIGEPTGGVYWLMEALIPGYDAFRYPAKLFVVAALPICILGGRGLDRLMDSTESNHRFTNRLMGLSLFVLIVSVCAVAACVWSKSDDASQQIYESVLHTCVVLTLLGVLLLTCKRKIISQAAFQKALVGLGIVDLIVAVAWTVCTVEPLPEQIGVGQDVSSNGAWTVFRDPVYDPQIRGGGWEPLPNKLANKLARQLAIDRETLFPKHHLLKNKRVIGSFHSIQPLDISSVLMQLEILPPDKRKKVLEALGAEAQIPQIKGTWNERGRFYLTQRVDCLLPINEKSPKQVAERTIEFVNRANGWDQQNQVLAECDPPILLLKDKESDPPSELKLVSDETSRIELQLTIQSWHLLVVADYFDENWKAWRIDNDGSRTELKCDRVNRVQRGYQLGKGQYRVEMIYQPTWFYHGALTSCLAWLIVGGLWYLDRRRR